jgi:hypothetical protein
LSGFQKVPQALGTMMARDPFSVAAQWVVTACPLDTSFSESRLPRILWRVLPDIPVY